MGEVRTERIEGPEKLRGYEGDAWNGVRMETERCVGRIDETEEKVEKRMR